MHVIGVAGRRAAHLALVAVTLAACNGTSASRQVEQPVDTARAATAVAEAAVDLPPLETLPSTEAAVDGAPASLLHAFGAVWAMGHRSTELRRLDPVTGDVTGEIDVGVLGCGDLIEAAGFIWVSGCGPTPYLARVNPATNEVQTVRTSGLGVAELDGKVWFARSPDETGRIRRADPAALQAAESFAVPGLRGAEGVVGIGDSVWVSDERTAIVYQLDASNGEVRAAIPMPLEAGKGYLIEHDGAPWFVDAEQGALVRVDPDTGTPTLLEIRLEKPPTYWGIAASSAPGQPGGLWMRSGSDEAWLLDTRADEVLRRVAVVAGGGGDVQEVDGALFVASFGTHRVQRISLT